MHCGLDFGTSNSTLGIALDGRGRLVALEDHHTTVPSACFYGEEASAPIIGRAAIASYLDAEPGRFMRSMKSVLGTSLMEDATRIGRRQVPLTSVVEAFIGELKRRAEQHVGRALTQVVQGRPVRFVDDDAEADAKAEATLGRILSGVGFEDVVFVLEPIAAARHFEATVERECLLLVADIGGGTSDFTIVRADPRARGASERRGDVLASHGLRLGGTDFDQRLSLANVMPLLGHGAPLGVDGLTAPVWIYFDLASPARIAQLYSHRNLEDIRGIARRSRTDPRFQRLARVMEGRLGHLLAARVEAAKIALGNQAEARVDLGVVEAGLEACVVPADLVMAIAAGLERLGDAVEECVRLAGIRATTLERVVLTGGSTEMPAVREAIAARLPGATIDSIDTFGAVGAGLALEAERIFAGTGPH